MSARWAAVAIATVFALPALAEDRRVEIVNDTGVTMTRFYGSHQKTDDWEEDILGDDMLYPGQSVVINFDDGTGYCLFDFRAVFEDGDEVVEYGVDVCDIGTFTYN
jgi:hypothetical protein